MFSIFAIQILGVNNDVKLLSSQITLLSSSFIFNCIMFSTSLGVLCHIFGVKRLRYFLSCQYGRFKISSISSAVLRQIDGANKSKNNSLSQYGSLNISFIFCGVERQIRGHNKCEYLGLFHTISFDSSPNFKYKISTISLYVVSQIEEVSNPLYFLSFHSGISNIDSTLSEEFLYKDAHFKYSKSLSFNN